MATLSAMINEIVGSKKSLSSRLSMLVVLYLTTSTVVFSQCVQAHVTFRLQRSTYRFPSYASTLGRNFADKQKRYNASLLNAPSDNLDMCRNETFVGLEIPGRTFNRYVVGDMREPPPIALLVKESNCDIEQKARNVMDINSRYAQPNGSRIEFLIIINRDNGVIDNREVSDPENPIDLYITHVSNNPGSVLPEILMDYAFENANVTTELTPAAFLPIGDPERNNFTFLVYIDDAALSFPYVYMLYVFVGIVLGIPILRFLVLTVVNRGFRWRRDESGSIAGVSWNRSAQRMRVLERQREEWWGESEVLFQSVWRQFNTSCQLGRLTEDQVKALPEIEYNVSDIKEATRRFDNGKSDKDAKEGEGGDRDGVAIDKGDKGDKGEDEGGGKSMEIEGGITSTFLQNAYASCTSCPICIDEFEQGQKLILLPQCGHFFHRECIEPWLKDRKGTCPLCQTVVEVSDDGLRRSIDCDRIIVTSPTDVAASGSNDTGADLEAPVIGGTVAASSPTAVAASVSNDTGAGGGGNDTLDSDQPPDTDTRSGGG